MSFIAGYQHPAEQQDDRDSSEFPRYGRDLYVPRIDAILAFVIDNGSAWKWL